MATFYAIDSSSLLAYYYSKKHEDLMIKDDTSQLSDKLAPRQKWEIIKYVKSKELY